MGYKGNLENLNKDATFFLINNLFNHKEKILTKKLIHFFEKQAHLLIENSDLLKVISFEFDSIMSFTFVVYPDPNIIPQSYWKEQFTLDCSSKNDYDVLESLCEKFNLEEWDDAFVSKDNEDYYVDIYEILNELNYIFFQNAWKKAKQKCGVKYRGFLFWHDVYYGIDLDTGNSAKSEDVISILTNEQLDFKILQERVRERLEYFKNDKGIVVYAILSLPSFSEFKYIRASDKEQIVKFESDDKSSLESKQNALNYLINNEEHFFESLVNGILKAYQLDSRFDNNIRIESKEEVKQNILIRDVRINQKSIDGFSLIFIGGSCSWNEDKGFSVIMHKDNFMKLDVWND